jgi:hypothetical protein
MKKPVDTSFYTTRWDTTGRALGSATEGASWAEGPRQPVNPGTSATRSQDKVLRELEKYMKFTE